MIISYTPVAHKPSPRSKCAPFPMTVHRRGCCHGRIASNWISLECIGGLLRFGGPKPFGISGTSSFSQRDGIEKIIATPGPC